MLEHWFLINNIGPRPARFFFNLEGLREGEENEE